MDVLNDGEQAAAHGLIDQFDLAILDLGLPKRDGMEVLRGWRGRGAKLPVLLLTARDELGDRVQGLNAGADDYLVKPFDLPELVARLRALKRRAEGRITETLSLGELTLDLAHRELMRLVVDAPREVMDGADAPCSAMNRPRLPNVDDPWCVFEAVPYDAVLFPESVESQHVGDECRRRACVAFPELRAMKTTDLPLARYRAAIPRRRAPFRAGRGFDQRNFEAVRIDHRHCAAAPGACAGRYGRRATRTRSYRPGRRCPWRRACWRR